MKKRTFLAVATVAFALHTGIMAYMIVKREITLTRGERFSFRSAPYDPHDVFRGKYVRVDIEGDGPFTNKVEFRRGQKLYASLQVGDGGIAVMDSVGAQPPADAPYIRVECSSCVEQQVKTGVVLTNFMYYCQQKKEGQWRWRSEEEVARDNLEYTKVHTNTVDKYKYTGRYLTYIKAPFSRFYLDEKMAPQAESLYREHSRAGGSRDTLLHVRVHKGYALAESLEIGGVPVRELIAGKQKAKEKTAPAK